jgi:hypothetical protein
MRILGMRFDSLAMIDQLAACSVAINFFRRPHKAYGVYPGAFLYQHSGRPFHAERPRFAISPRQDRPRALCRCSRRARNEVGLARFRLHVGQSLITRLRQLCRGGKDGRDHLESIPAHSQIPQSATCWIGVRNRCQLVATESQLAANFSCPTCALSNQGQL